MSRHVLAGRSEFEVRWMQRRSFMQAACAWGAVGGFAGARAQQRGNIIELTGDALINGQRPGPDHTIQTSDEIVTGPNSNLIFVMGNSSFQVRQNSHLVLEGSAGLSLVSTLRLLTGAVVSVWGKGTPRRIVTPTATMGIRGTGTYTEVLSEQNFRSYFCNCYGTVDVGAGTDQVLSQSDYHQSFWVEPTAINGRFIFPAKAINHTDDELEALASLVNQRTSWQILGRKGIWDGRGYIGEQPGQTYPSDR